MNLVFLKMTAQILGTQTAQKIVAENINLEEFFRAFNTVIDKHTPRQKTFREKMEDPSNTSYGPFPNMKDAIAFLDRDL